MFIVLYQTKVEFYRIKTNNNEKSSQNTEGVCFFFTKHLALQIIKSYRHNNPAARYSENS
jgi:hypothetical protein